MLSFETILIRLSLALLLGGVIGIEREYRNKSAGFRTLTLICVGSCLFTLVSLLITNGTTDRIASNIVTGIGFIGAGVIFKSDKGVNGLTTAASIWITAAIGMAVGAGLYKTAISACIIVWIVISLFTLIEKVVDKLNQDKVYRITTSFDVDVLAKYESLMRENHLKYKRFKRTRHDQQITGIWTVQGSQKNHDRFMEIMLKDLSIKEFDF